MQHKQPIGLLTADQKSQYAREVSALCVKMLEYPAAAHQAHESAAAAHDNEAIGPDRDLHLRLAREHRAAASYWALKETQWQDNPFLSKRKN